LTIFILGLAVDTVLFELDNFLGIAFEDELGSLFSSQLCYSVFKLVSNAMWLLIRHNNVLSSSPSSAAAALVSSLPNTAL